MNVGLLTPLLTFSQSHKVSAKSQPNLYTLFCDRKFYTESSVTENESTEASSVKTLSSFSQRDAPTPFCPIMSKNLPAASCLVHEIPVQLVPELME